MNELIADRFRIERLIGRGGNGNVYRGVDMATGHMVAIKILKNDALLDDPTLLTRFLQEAEMLRQLNHPNIAKVIANFDMGDEHYLVMDYIEGGSLKDLLGKHPQMPIDRILQIGLDVADALTRAHRLRIVHRDIKPSNILLKNDGTPCLTDFGVARMVDSGVITRTNDLIGTSAYLSPEVLTGEIADTRSDIWSFGVVLYEMLAGRRPFEEEQQVAILVSILNKPIPDLKKLRPDAPPQLVSLIYDMLEKNRERRISSVRLVGAELEAIIQGLDTSIRQSLPAVAFSRFQPPTETFSRRIITEEEKAVLNFKRRIGCMIIFVLLLLTLSVVLVAILAYTDATIFETVTF